MMEMASPLPRPNRDRMGALTSLILVSYALIQIVTLPTLEPEVSIIGLLLSVRIDVRTVMLTLATALAASGALWILQSHPLARIRQPDYAAGLLPGLAALGMGAVLNQISVGPQWLVGLMLAGLVFAGVLYAEFVVFDERDPRLYRAALGLRSLGIVIILGIVFAVEVGGLRAVFSVPAVFAGSTLICWRSLRLEISDRSVWPFSLACGLIAAQITWGLHYWPIRPMQVALLIALSTYVAIGLQHALLHKSLNSRVLYEFGGIVVLVLGVALLLA